jgi:hypothetical protein
MNWHCWVLSKFAGDAPPREWINILDELKKVISGKNIDKIEYASFVIRGERKARWLLDRAHSEYSTKNDALGAAKKLTWLLMKSRGAPLISKRLKRLLINDEKFIDETTTCPLCKEIIKIDDYNLSGRNDLYSIQMGHLIPLSLKPRSHNAGNVVWMHRRCNYIQDEQTIDNTINFLKQILKTHEHIISTRRRKYVGGKGTKIS